MYLDDSLEKLKKFCAYQERCHHEVRNKLLKLRVYGDDLEEIISELIKENYLNEERYARSYARGKFKNNKWGRIKIKQGLKAKQISEYSIRKAMTEINEEEYEQVLTNLIEKKVTIVVSDNQFALFSKLSKYGLQKGFEYEHVKAAIHNVLNSK